MERFGTEDYAALCSRQPLINVLTRLRDMWEVTSVKEKQGVSPIQVDTSPL